MPRPRPLRAALLPVLAAQPAPPLFPVLVAQPAPPLFPLGYQQTKGTWRGGPSFMVRFQRASR